MGNQSSPGSSKSKSARKVNCFKKYKLLMWKNILILLNHKTEFLAELAIAIVLFTILIILRNKFGLEKHAKHEYKPEELNLNAYNEFIKKVDANQVPKSVIIYSPINIYLDAILNATAEYLNVSALGVENEKLLTEILDNEDYLAGIVLDDYLKNRIMMPNQMRFKILMPADVRTKRMGRGRETNIISFLLGEREHKFAATWRTDQLYMHEEHGPRNPDDNDGGVPAGYLESGFLAIQYALAVGYLKTYGNRITIPKVLIQRFPYPEYTHDTLMPILQGILPIIVILSLCMPIFFVTMTICREKENGLKELLKAIGVPNWIQWVACFCQSLLLMMTFLILLTGVLKIPFSSESGACLNHSDITAVFSSFFVYILACISFCCLNAVLFDKPLWAAITATTIFALTLFSPENYDDKLLVSKILFAINFNNAISYVIIIITRHETNGIGLQWNNMFKPPTPDDNISMGIVLVVIFCTAVFIMCLTLYVEQLFPGQYGVPRTWDYIFTAKFWNCEYQGRSKAGEGETYAATFTADDDDFDTFEDDADNFEGDPLRKRLVVESRQVNKKVGTKNIIREMTFNIFEDEVTVLLGHERSGKSTIINIMTGMLTPTIGVVNIHGFDIHTEANNVRHILGICPEMNSLFAELNVRQQLVFYCELKGLIAEQVDDEVDRYLHVMDLEDEAHVPCGGIHHSAKRKVMLCCALCAGSRVVFCDEPTLDMEPADRYATWNLLRSEKIGRAIIVTTKTMEEAEVLADRMAVICFGDIKCYGTQYFLKNLYGAGHHLICFQMPDCDVERITALLRKFIPEISVKNSLGLEITYSLPDKYSYLFPEMLRHLEEKSDHLKIKGFEICTINVEQACFQVQGNVVGGKRAKTTNKPEVEISTTILSRNPRLLQGRKLLTNQWRALILKNYITNIRARTYFLGVILFPTVLSFFGIFFLSSIGHFGEMQPMVLNLLPYHRGTALLEVAPDVEPGSKMARIANHFRSHIVKEYVEELGNRFHFVQVEIPFSEYIHKITTSDEMRAIINTQYLIAATVKKDEIIAWMNNQALHTAPVALNIVLNAIIRRVVGHDNTMQPIISPLVETVQKTIERAGTWDNSTYITMTMLTIGIFTVTAAKIMHPIEERVSGTKDLQLRGGVSAGMYWFTMYVFDLLLYGCSTILAIVAFECFHKVGFGTWLDIAMLGLVVTLYGVVIIPQYYVLSFLFSQPIIGFMVALAYNYGVGTLLFTALMDNKDAEIPWLLQLIAQQSFLLALHNFAVATSTEHICKAVKHSKLSCESSPMCCKKMKYFSFESPGFSINLILMFVNGIIFTICLCLIECLKDYVTKFQTVARIKPDYKEIDSDVQAETVKISSMNDAERSKYALVVDRISKAYKNCVAVKRLSFCVSEYECFGLIGAKGAGLTTVFRMLSGDTLMTRGAAYIQGHNIKSNSHLNMKRVSYCPRFNAYIKQLSGRENLIIFALLRGVPPTHVKLIINELTNIFGITKYLDREVSGYSEDNKRKLSVAIALLGNPLIIYLDVPTDGLDPEGKRQLWGALADIRASGKAVVLGSNSMTECKALCTRLGVLVNGEFLCLGSMEHLKSKFTQGIVIKVKVNIDSSQHNLIDWIYSKVPGRLKGPSDTRGARLRYLNRDDHATQVNLQNIGEIKKLIFLKFPGSTLQKEFEGNLTFFMPSQGNLKWSEMFRYLDQYRRRSYIERYSISQATLDSIFVQLSEQGRRNI